MSLPRVPERVHEKPRNGVVRLDAGPFVAILDSVPTIREGIVMSYRWIFVFLLLFAPHGSAAESPLPSSTPHGILVDRVLPLAQLQAIDGSPGAPVVSAARWRQAVHELRRSAEQDLGWPDPRALQNAARNSSLRNEVPLALLYAQYDRQIAEGRVAGNTVIALGVLRERVHHGSDLVFRLTEDRILSHAVGKVIEMTLDAGDGRGPRLLVPGQEFAVSYATTGPKELTLRLRTADGDQFLARSALDVRLLAVPTPTETWQVQASEAYQGVAASGQAYLYLAPGRAELRNPVVVVEGFDLDNTMDWPVLYELLNQEGLLEDLRADGYDAVVLDFTEATHPIQRNALLLTELLTRIHETIPSNKSIALVGASMGGLVARYALLLQENQGIDSRVRTYVSFDSPHQGANIPLGMQHWLDFFSDESTDAAFLLSRLNTPASRQMLLYHYQQTAGGSSGADPLRTQWMLDLTGLGGWPSIPRKVAVANGSADGVGQGFAAGQQILEWEYASFLVDITGNVWAAPSGAAQQRIFDGEINRIWPLPDNYQTVTVGGITAWDHAPGGWRSSMAEAAATEAPYGDIVALFDNHCFVPTVSALALQGVTPFHDVAGDAALMSRTAFDALYYPVTASANQEHIHVSPETKAWLMAEVEAGVSAVEESPRVALPQAHLLAATPNPFNPSTRVRWSLPNAAEAEVGIYDLKGRRVRQLAGGMYPAGDHSVLWTGRDEEGRKVPSGIYFVQLRSGADRDATRLVLIK